MTTKFVLDESAHVLHRVVGYAHPWEQLAPGIRVRRRVIKALRPEAVPGIAAWPSAFGPDVDGSSSER